MVNAWNLEREKQFAEDPGFLALCFSSGAHLEMVEPSVLYSPGTRNNLALQHMAKAKNVVWRWTVEPT